MPDKIKQKMGRFRRWVMIGGKFDLMGLVKIARKLGMKIICGSKPCLHVYYEIGLSGTTTMMNKVVAIWSKAGHIVKNRRPKGAFNICITAPSNDWAEKFLPKLINKE